MDCGYRGDTDCSEIMNGIMRIARLQAMYLCHKPSEINYASQWTNLYGSILFLEICTTNSKKARFVEQTLTH